LPKKNHIGNKRQCNNKKNKDYEEELDADDLDESLDIQNTKTRYNYHKK